jgi:hypothetical protein
MSVTPDPRIPVVFGTPGDAGRDDALLVEREDGPFCDMATGAAEAFVSAARPAHAIGCACCSPRRAAAEALGRLFLARARGDGPPFRRVVAATLTQAGAAAIRAALVEDRVAAARFRLG